MSDFCKRLKKAMEIRGISQSELCEKTGITKSAMSQYISGAFKPKQARTYLLAKALDVNESWLLGYDVPMERAKNNAEQIYYEFVGLNTILSDFPTTDTKALNTKIISDAIEKTMEINKMYLSTPRAYIPTISIDEAVIGLKFLLAYYRINFQNFSNDSLGKLINNALFKDFIKNIIINNVQDEKI